MPAVYMFTFLHGVMPARAMPLSGVLHIGWIVIRFLQYYIDILPKNIYYTATIQLATFRPDLDLRLARLGLSVQHRIKLHC